LCDSLSKHFKDVIPEQNRIDITFENWAIELKTINTNIRFPNVKNKHRPITRNTQGVVKDIEKLRTTEYTNKSTLFIVFPVRHRNKDWQVQLRRITNKLVKIEHLEFNFKDKIPGTIYFGLTN
ncbi:MAG: hypothetical protein OEY24_01580, partial [Candidatus Bathyarchaeota archaeon]|nr:hypothetical protein [Candidatus Bathyarchaeota archaeon]